MTEQQKIAAKLGLFDPVAALLKDESEKIASVLENLPTALDHSNAGNKSAAFAPEGEVEQGWADEAAQKLQEWVAQGKDPRHFAEAYAKETAPTGRSALIGGLGGAGLGAGAGALARSLAGSHARGSTGLWAAGGALAGGLLGARGLPRQQRRQGEEIAQYAIASQLGQPKQGSEEKLALPAGMMSPGAGVEAELTARASQGMEQGMEQGMDPSMGQGKEGAAKTAQPPMQQGQMQQGQMQGQMPQMGSPEMQAQQAMMDAEAMKADPLEAQNETLRKVIQNQKLKLELADLTTKVMQAAQPPQMPQMGPEEGPEAGGDGQMMGDPMEYMRQALTE